MVSWAGGVSYKQHCRREHCTQCLQPVCALCSVVIVYSLVFKHLNTDFHCSCLKFSHVPVQCKRNLCDTVLSSLPLLSPSPGHGGTTVQQDLCAWAARADVTSHPACKRVICMGEDAGLFFIAVFLTVHKRSLWWGSGSQCSESCSSWRLRGLRGSICPCVPPLGSNRAGYRPGWAWSKMASLFKNNFIKLIFRIISLEYGNFH